MAQIRRFIVSIFAITALCCALSVCAGAKTYEVYGTVTYPDGQPAPGVELTWQRLNECRENKVTTDSNGCYRISVEGKTVGNYAGFHAKQGDYALSDSVTIPEGTDQPVRKDLKFEFTALVLGEVTDASTGEPVADAEVHIYGSYGAETKTGADGRFRVKVLPRSGLELSVGKDGYVTNRMDFSGQDTYATGWRVQLKPGGVVRGTVLDTSGAPVAGIRVNITEDRCYGRCARTDEDGRYEMRNVDPDRPAEMRVEDPRIGMSETKHFEFPKGSMETTGDFVVNLAGKELRTVSGSVTDEKGTPVAGATVRFGQSTCHWNVKEGQTDAEGNYALSGLAPEKNLVLVRAEGYAPAFMPVEDNGDQRIDVKLTKAHSTELRVVGPSGQPIDGASVTVNARTPVLGRLNPDYGQDRDLYRWLYTTTTDDNGRVTLKDLPAEGVLIDVYKKDYAAPDNATLRVDSVDNVIRMQGMPQVAGTVTDAATGAPIRCFTVKWADVGGYSLGGDDSMAFNRADGKFVVQVGDSRFIDKREFTVRVLAKGYVGEEKMISATDAPKTDYSNLFRLQKAYALKGRVVDALGKGVAGAQVTVVENRDYQYFIVPPKISRTAYQQKYTTDPDGSFTIDPVMERTAVLIVEKQGYPKLVDQKADLTKPLKLTLLTPATLTINAARLAGEGARVNLTFVKNRCSTTQPSKEISKDGYISYPNLEPGDYIAYVHCGRQSEMRAISLKPGQTFTLDLDKERPVVVKGLVTRQGAPVPDVTVEVQRGMNIYSSSSTTDSQGRYAINVEETGPAELNHYQRKNGQMVGYHGQRTDLKPGENTIDIKLPSGSVSGRVVDAKTGEPFEGRQIFAWAKWDPPTSRHYNYPVTKGGFGERLSEATTAKDGSFALENMPDGPIVLVVAGRYQQWIGSPITVSERTPVEGVEVKLPEPGMLKVSVVDAKTGKPVSAQISLYTPDRAPAITDNRYDTGTSVPAGKYVLWVEPTDDRHLPASTDVEVKSEKTARVTIKLNPCRQRIVFRVAKDGKLEKLRWPDKDPKSSKTVDVLTVNEDLFKERPWIGFALSDVATGKAVLVGPNGPEWGGYLSSFDPNRETALPVKAGRYVLDAVLRNTEDYLVASNADLSKLHREITVTEGEDTVVTMK